MSNKKASQGTLDAAPIFDRHKVSNEEYEAYIENIASKSDGIMDAVRMKVKLTDGADVDQLSKAVVLAGQKDAFVALAGALMMFCFHIGWKAAKGEKEEKV